MESPEAGSSIPSPTIQSQLDGKSPTSSSSSPETPDSTRLEAEGGGEDDVQSALDLLRSPQERPRRQRSSPTAIIESPPNEPSTKPKKKTGGSKKGIGGAKAALQERKRRRVLTEWAPENVFDIIRTFSSMVFILLFFFLLSEVSEPSIFLPLSRPISLPISSLLTLTTLPFR
jgi:hypothetical protein